MAIPTLEFEPAACSKCGAINEAQAETICLQTQDETGEYSCSGEFDAKGIAVRATAASLKRLDAYCEREGRRIPDPSP